MPWHKLPCPLAHLRGHVLVQHVHDLDLKRAQACGGKGHSALEAAASLGALYQGLHHLSVEGVGPLLAHAQRIQKLAVGHLK